MEPKQRTSLIRKDFLRLALGSIPRSVICGTVCITVLTALVNSVDQGFLTTYLMSALTAACIGRSVGRWPVFFSVMMGGVLGSLWVNMMAYRHNDEGLCFGLERLLNFSQESNGAVLSLNYSNHFYPVVDWPVFPIMWLFLGLSLVVLRPLWHQVGWVLAGALFSCLGTGAAIRLMVPAAKVLLEYVFGGRNTEINCTLIDLTLGTAVFFAGFFPVILTIRYVLGEPPSAADDVEAGTAAPTDRVVRFENISERQSVE